MCVWVKKITTNEICKVIDSDIATGSATVFNRNTKKVENLKYAETAPLPPNVKRLCEDTQELDCGH